MTRYRLRDGKEGNRLQAWLDAFRYEDLVQDRVVRLGTWFGWHLSASKRKR